MERWKVEDSSTSAWTSTATSQHLGRRASQDSSRSAAGWHVTAGVRYDDHSDFGDVWSPRANVAWRRGTAAGSCGRPAARLSARRRSGSSSTRSPATPTSSPSGRRRGRSARAISRHRGRLGVSLFWNESREPDRLRLRGGPERQRRPRAVARRRAGWRQKISDRLDVDAGYTWLETEDRDTGSTCSAAAAQRRFLGRRRGRSPRL